MAERPCPYCSSPRVGDPCWHHPPDGWNNWDPPCLELPEGRENQYKRRLGLLCYALAYVTLLTVGSIGLLMSM